jgi:DNA-binding HxlR family transcriptional regulator
MEVTIAENEASTISAEIEKIMNPGQPTGFGCPVRSVLDRVGDKWSILTILSLGSAGTLRFNELKTRIEGISQRMLTVTLRSLEQDGLVSRTVYPTVPPRVDYTLTPLGCSLLQQMLGLTKWANEHIADIAAARERYTQ